APEDRVLAHDASVSRPLGTDFPGTDRRDTARQPSLLSSVRGELRPVLTTSEIADLRNRLRRFCGNPVADSAGTPALPRDFRSPPPGVPAGSANGVPAGSTNGVPAGSTKSISEVVIWEVVIWQVRLRPSASSWGA